MFTYLFAGCIFNHIHRQRIKKCVCCRAQAINNPPQVTSFPQPLEAVSKTVVLPLEQNDCFLFPQRNQAAIRTSDIPGQSVPHGLLHYRKWWERTKVELSLNNKLIVGTPVFIEQNTIRVMTADHSYFIPLDKIDYIRTNDGLQTHFKDDRTAESSHH